MLRNRNSISGLPTANSGGYDSRASFGSQGGGGYGNANNNYQQSSQSGGSYGGYSGGNSNGYGGYQPQSSSMSISSHDDKYASKKRGGNGNLMQMAPLIGCAVLGLWALTATMMNWSKGSQLKQIYREAGMAANVQEVIDFIQAERRRAHTIRQEAKDSLRDHTDKHSSKVNLLQEQIKELTAHRDALVDKHESDKAKSRKREKREIREWREEAYYEQIQLLEARVRKDSKRIVVERFGPGPHKVAMYFRIPDGMGNLGPEQRMVIQLAPLDLVPHAVHFFLEQIEHGLWNSENYIYLNGPHVLQIGPQVWEEDYGEMTDEEYEERRVGHFYELGLEELIFPDYSEEYPHVQYTLGFTGRPGGPDFYINKLDNSETHGPGGQDQHALDHQADSCFGMIVEGIEVMQTIFNAKTYAEKGWEWMVEEPIPITRAEILTKRPANPTRTLPANGGQQQQQMNHQHPPHNHHQAMNAEQQFQAQGATGGATGGYQAQQSYDQQQQFQQQQFQQNNDPQQFQQQQQKVNYDGNHHQQGHHARMPLDHSRNGVTP